MRALYALVDELSRPEGESARRRTQAARAVAAYPAPAAVFGGISGATELTNEAWRGLFAGIELPALLVTAIGRRQEVLLREIEVGSRVVTISIEPLRAAKGAVVICMDVTDQTLARRLGLDADALLWSPTGYTNKAWQCRVRQRWQDAIYSGDMRRWLAVVQSVQDGQRSASIDVRIVIDNTPRWHRVTLGAHRGELLCGAVDVHDSHERDNMQRKLLAELRRARESAARADRLRDEFLAVISHELRSPLTTMLLWEKVLRENGDNERARVDALDAIHQSANQQVRMFGDLLDYARGMSGKLALDLRALELGRVVDAAVDAVRAAAVEKSIDIAVHALTGTITMQGDVTRLRQVLDNVLSNAVKFTPRGGKIRVSVARARSAVIIEVEDSGRGIAPELLSRAFEPFAQAQNALNRREGGLGLGLTIARQLVELHRGTLELASRGLGLGATVTIHLPVADTRDREVPRRTASAPSRLNGTHVLVIDDDAGVRRGLAVLLERLGVEVDTADSASMARQQIATRAPHAVICDIAMPDEDGYSFVRCLRRSGVDVPSIALTAFATEDDVHRALDAGFDAHLTKPIRIERLVDTLSEVLASQRNCSST